VANLSSQAGTTTLTVTAEVASAAENNSPDPQSAIRNPQSLTLGPRETRRLILTLTPGAPALRARLGDDALGVDNEVVLLPQTERPVRVELRVQNDALRPLVEKAIASARGVLLTADRPELILTDQAEGEVAGSEAWVMRIVADRDAQGYLGPFVVDHAHPLAEGLALGGVVWGAGKPAALGGRPVITAGNIPLLVDVDRGEGRHDLRLRLRPDLSTLHETPNWPILIWNLIHWRAASSPGLRLTNLRLGADATLAVEPGTAAIEVAEPDGKTRRLPVRGKTVSVRADRIGVYELKTERSKYLFASNALRQEESDLTAGAAGRWGDWVDPVALQSEYRSVAWVFLLLALAVMAAHLALIARGARVRRA
jgi:hypothetical protein